MAEITKEILAETSFYGYPAAKIAGFPYGEWTTEPPTKEGWYWFRNEWPQPFCAWVSVNNNEMQVGQVGAQWDISKITHWLGPLTEPEMPKG